MEWLSPTFRHLIKILSRQGPHNCSSTQSEFRAFRPRHLARPLSLSLPLFLMMTSFVAPRMPPFLSESRQYHPNVACLSKVA